MAVYVDKPLHVWRGKKWCHLLADDLVELHAFAKQIGLKREWFQAPPAVTYPHYDIPEFRRNVALRQGAIEVGRREIVAKARGLGLQYAAIETEAASV